MKTLTLIVHADLKQTLADLLRSLPGIGGFLFTPVEGHAPQDGRDAFLSARDRVVGYVPHVRVDLVLDDHAVDSTLKALQAASNNLGGGAEFWISPIERHGRL